MTNRQNGEVSIEIEGKTYTLFLGTNAMVQLEALFSTDKREMTFVEILERINRNSITHLRGMIWAALRKHHPDVTLNGVGDLIELAGGIVAFNNQIAALAQSARPDQEDVEALGVTPSNGSGNPPAAQSKPRRGTGGRSTSMRDASV